MNPRHFTTTSLILLGGSAAVFALAPAGGTGLPHVFQAGTPARASEVNENFVAMAQRIADLELALDELRATTAFLSLEQGEIEGLSGPHLIFEGVNVHVRSGSGSTDDGGVPTGLGNLIVGYNELASLPSGSRAGGHNLVLGSRNAFTSVGGIVAGTDNRISAEFASVLGGGFGTASGRNATITGGGGAASNLFNTASGEFSSVTGGLRNVASGAQSSVTGGSNHQASGFLSAISGGAFNVASGAGASVSGGSGNQASQSNSSVSGGSGGTASGIGATVSGGLNRAVSTNFGCADCNG